jgi:hypothetical protein
MLEKFFANSCGDGAWSVRTLFIVDVPMLFEYTNDGRYERSRFVVRIKVRLKSNVPDFFEKTGHPSLLDYGRQDDSENFKEFLHTPKLPAKPLRLPNLFKQVGM